MAHYIFVSHRWNHDESYKEIIKKLKEHYDIDIKDYSISKEKAIDGHDDKVWQEIESSIKSCSVVLVPNLASHSYGNAVERELKLASDLKKRIIAINQDYRLKQQESTIVKKYATEFAEWRVDSIIKAIKGY